MSALKELSMLRSTGRAATIERFIGWLTVALGVGAMVPRNGMGLYALLEAEGIRALFSVMLINVGCLAVAFSYIPLRSLRVFLQVVVALLWGWLIYKFVNAQLWGAAFQGCVVVSFAISSAIRISLYGGYDSDGNTSTKTQRRTSTVPASAAD